MALPVVLGVVVGLVVLLILGRRAPHGPVSRSSERPPFHPSPREVSPLDAGNPYASPAEFATAEPAPQPAGIGALPCHRCGESVEPKSKTCPACGAKPLYDDLQLLVTAVVVFVAVLGYLLMIGIDRALPAGIPGFVPLVVAIAILMPTIAALFKTLRRGRW